MRVARLRAAGATESRAGAAVQVQRYMTGAGIIGVARVKGSNRLLLPAYRTGMVSGARMLPHGWTMAQALDYVDEQYAPVPLGDTHHTPFIVRVTDEQIERAQVTLRLEDFTALLLRRQA